MQLSEHQLTALKLISPEVEDWVNCKYIAGYIISEQHSHYINWETLTPEEWYQWLFSKNPIVHRKADELKIICKLSTMQIAVLNQSGIIPKKWIYDRVSWWKKLSLIWYLS